MSQFERDEFRERVVFTQTSLDFTCLKQKPNVFFMTGKCNIGVIFTLTT